jgi:hypothetical protein
MGAARYRREPDVLYMSTYVTFRKVPNGLSIEPTPEGVEEAKELLERRAERVCAPDITDMIESALGNGWSTVPPEDIGALTDCVIISEDGFHAEDGKWWPHPDAKPAVVFAHMNYAVEDPIATWSEGKAVFLVSSEVELTAKGRRDARRKLKKVTG